MKYIIFEDDRTGVKEPVIFGDHTVHSEVKVGRAHPVSAGYFMLDNEGIVSTYGYSPSLRLKPKEGDATLLYYVLRNMGAIYFMDSWGMGRWENKPNEPNKSRITNQMKKRKVYISGAIAHYDIGERMSAFRRAENLLAVSGYSPVNPFRNGLSQDAPWREHMRVDIALLLTCDYIYMLKGWELSKGAKLELDVASSCGIKVLFE